MFYRWAFVWYMSVGNNLIHHRILYVYNFENPSKSSQQKQESYEAIGLPFALFLLSKKCNGTAQSILTTTMKRRNYKYVLFAVALVWTSSPNISSTNIFAVRDAGRHRLQVLTQRQAIPNFFTVFLSFFQANCVILFPLGHDRPPVFSHHYIIFRHIVCT